jgi:hypothetical protein
MKNALISILISTALSLCLLFGDELVAEFAFYVCAAMNFLSWSGVLLGVMDKEVAARIRRNFWLVLPSGIFAVYALIQSGHTFLAASSFMVQFFIVAAAFKQEAA